MKITISLHLNRDYKKLGAEKVAEKLMAVLSMMRPFVAIELHEILDEKE